MMEDLKTITILFRATNAMEAMIKEDVSTYQLNPTEFGVLEALYHLGPLNVQEIVNKVLIANSSMSYVLDELEKKQWIQRIKDIHDARVRKVSLTNQGVILMDDIYPTHVQTLRKRLNRLTSEEETLLQNLLKKIGIA
jgi:MarR family 2-MHQ and catechol resistance regulon transcriptional repressor